MTQRRDIGHGLRPAARLAASAGRGFTLLEMIVAVAAVALVAVGLASIFDAVGKTVSGGKRVSLLNQYAGLIENQMRRDFSEISRDGFLVVRQQFVDTRPGPAGDGLFQQEGPNADIVPLHAEDTSPRPRRADEIIFFVRGNYQSARQPISPDLVVTSDTAMIYYGHGQKRRPDATRLDPRNNQPDPNIFFRPQVDDLNNDTAPGRDARLGLPVAGNPNLFASEWTLLRKSTLLVKPDATGADPVSSPLRFTDPANPNANDVLDPANPAARRRLRNSEYQVNLQPAARSVFRSFNRFYPFDINGPARLPQQIDSFRELRRPNLTSGLVDIASTDLNEIRSFVNGLRLLPGSFDPATATGAFDLPNQVSFHLWCDPFPSAPAAWPWRYNVPVRTQPPPDFLDRMHVWMNDAFPGESQAGAPWGRTNAMRAMDPPGVRARYESQPVDLLEVIAGNFAQTAGAPVSRGQQAAYERADQLMLAGSGFLPRCSEFIVDWSFGRTDPVTGEIVWHGPAHRIDVNRNGTFNDPVDRWATLPYPYNARSQNPATQNLLFHSVEVPRLPYGMPMQSVLDPNGNPIPGPAPYQEFDRLPREYFYYTHVIQPRLIYGFDAWQPNAPVPSVLTSYFGYTDPTYKQDVLARPSPPYGPTPPNMLGDGIVNEGWQIDFNNDGFIGIGNDPVGEVIPGEPAAKSIPWAWPRMVRVTLTLADALDPSIESTFQFIFNVPDDSPIRE